MKGAVICMITLIYAGTCSAKFGDPSVQCVGDFYIDDSGTWECLYADGDEGTIQQVSWYRDMCFDEFEDSGETSQYRVYIYSSDGTSKSQTSWENRSVTAKNESTGYYVTLNSLTFDDERNMCCCVSDESNGSGRKCSNKVIKDIFARPTSEPTFTNNVVVEDIPSNVSCLTPNLNPPAKLKVFWKIPDVDEEIESTYCTNNTNTDGYTFNVTSILEYTFQRDAHEKNITCITRWEEEDGSIIELSTQSTELEVHYRPGKAVVTSQVNRVDINGTLTVSCELPGSADVGNPSYSRYGFQNSTWNSMSQTESSIEVTVHNVSDRYECYAITVSTIDNKELNGVPSDPASYEVYYPADSLYPGTDTDRNINPLYNDTDFTLTCKSAGFPTPSIDLAYYDDGDFTIKPDEAFIETFSWIDIDYMYGVMEGYQIDFKWNIADKIFTCDNVKEYDGEFIRCLSRNDNTDGEEQSDTSERYNLKTRYPPIYKGTETRAEHSQENVELVCDVCANPSNDISYKWFANGTDNGSGKTLQLSQVTEEEFDTTYECEATTSLDTKRFPVVLYESGPPRWNSMEVYSMENITSIAVTLVWEIGPDGNNPPVIYNIYGVDKASGLVYITQQIEQQGNVGDNMTYTVTSLNDSTTHQFFVEATNNRDITEGSNTTGSNLTSDDVSTLARPNVELNTVTISATEMQVTWSYLSGEVETSFDDTYSVGVRIKYWKEGANEDTDSITHPQDTVIPASDEQATIMNDFEDGTYNVELMVYENGLLSESSANTELIQESGVPPDNGNDSVGLIVGLVIVALVVVVAAALLFVFVARNRNSNQDNSTPEINISNPPVDEELQAVTNPAFTTEPEDKASTSVEHEELQEHAQITRPKHKKMNKAGTNKSPIKTEKSSTSVHQEPTEYAQVNRPKRPKLAVSVQVRPSVTSERTVQERLQDTPYRTLSEDGNSIYIEVSFPHYDVTHNDIVHGDENKTEYSAIDFTKKAPPPVMSSDDDQGFEDEEDVFDYLPDRTEDIDN